MWQRDLGRKLSIVAYGLVRIRLSVGSAIHPISSIERLTSRCSLVLIAIVREAAISGGSHGADVEYLNYRVSPRGQTVKLTGT